MAIVEGKGINYNQDLIKLTRTAYEATSNEYISKHAYTKEVNGQANHFINLVRKNPQENKKILDIGCGPGRDAEFFSDRKFSVYGIDLVNDFISLAQRRVPKGFFFIRDMRKTDFDKNYFDGIWNCTALMHLPEPQEAMEEQNRILKKNGILYLSVLNKPKDSVLTGEKYGKGGKFFKGYTQKSLSKLVSDSGFEIIKEIKNPKNIQNLPFIDIFARKI